MVSTPIARDVHGARSLPWTLSTTTALTLRASIGLESATVPADEVLAAVAIVSTLGALNVPVDVWLRRPQRRHPQPSAVPAAAGPAQLRLPRVPAAGA